MAKDLKFTVVVTGAENTPECKISMEFDPPIADENNVWDGSGAGAPAIEIFEAVKAAREQL